MVNEGQAVWSYRITVRAWDKVGPRTGSQVGRGTHYLPSQSGYEGGDLDFSINHQTAPYSYCFSGKNLPTVKDQVANQGTLQS